MKNRIEILDRALCIMLLADRGLLERENHGGQSYPLKDREAKRVVFLNVVEDRGLGEFFSSSEMRILNTPVGNLSQSDFVNSQWGYEAISVLLWAINVEGMISFSATVCSTDYHSILGQHRKNGKVLTQGNERNFEEITTMKEIALFYHWRAREGVKNPNFSTGDLLQNVTAIFGSDFCNLIKSNSSVKVAGDGADILLEEKVFNNLSREQGDIALHVAQWRHHALGWICSDLQWEGVSTDTI